MYTIPLDSLHAISKWKRIIAAMIALQLVHVRPFLCSNHTLISENIRNVDILLDLLVYYRI